MENLQIAKKLKVLDRMRILETKIRVNQENKKQIKKQAYRVFLQDPPRSLPDYKILYTWRKIFVIAGILCLVIPAVQTIFFYDTIYYVPPGKTFKHSVYSIVEEDIDLEEVSHGFLRSIPVVFGLLFFIFTVFGIAVDWTIYRRWNNKYYLILDYNIPDKQNKHYQL